MKDATAAAALAPAEPPIVVEHRDALIYLLREAAELEHGIMCQYLYAAFTLKDSADEGLTAEQLEAVGRWRTTILEVARQEMLHLALGRRGARQNRGSAGGCERSLRTGVASPPLPHPRRPHHSVT